MKREELLIDIANKFIELNPNTIAIGGSLMLKLRGIDIGREIHDLDLITNEHVLTINIPKGIGLYNKDGKSPYVGGSIKCQCIDNDVTIDILPSNETIDIINGIPLGSIRGLIEAKIKYAQQDNDDAIKHQNDLIILKKLI